jgi:hypothetical protein
MVNVKLNNKWFEAGDNGQFCRLAYSNAINEAIRSIKNEYGEFSHFNFGRSTNSENASMYFHTPLFPYLGLDEPRGDCHPSIRVYAVIELGRGKKHINEKHLRIDVDISCYGKVGAPLEYKTLQKRLEEKVGRRMDIVRFQSELTEEQLLDATYFPKLVSQYLEEARTMVRETWREIQDGQTAREIDLSDVGPHIEEIFKAHGVPAGVETSTDIQRTVICISGLDEDEAGTLTLENTGDQWYITSGTYCYGFVNELFDLPKYHCKSYIKPEKFDELFGMIAEEFKHEHELRKRFAKVRGDFISDVEREN